MSVLSLSAIGRVTERRIRQAGTALAADEVLAWLTDTVGVDIDRAQAGLRLATFVGRLETTTDDEGRQCLRIPAKGKAA